MAITEVYVDPAIAGNSGAGTIGDPYGDLQYALDTKARDSTNGDRFNIKAGTAEVLAAALTLATYGTPTRDAPCRIQGYTSAAGDEGIGEIDGAASYKIFASNYASVIVEDMKIGNTGANEIVVLGGYSMLINCELHTSTFNSYYVNYVDTIIRCWAHDCTAAIFDLRATCVFHSFSRRGIFAGSIARGNSVLLTASGLTGITITGAYSLAEGNNVIGTSGTKYGIEMASCHRSPVINNIIEGFSGSGGKGVYIDSNTRDSFVGNNGFYNNATNVSGTVHHALGADVTYSASPFVDAANGDFRLKPGIRNGGYPTTFKGLTPTNYLDLGAMQGIQSMRRSRAVMIG